MKKKLAFTGISSIVVIAIIVVIVNLISVNLFGRIDLSEGKIYSLSDSSKEIVGSLEDRITIRCYFSEDLPPRIATYRRYLKDQLDEYKAYAGGKLNYAFIDPAKEGKEQEARGYGIPAIPAQTLARDKFEIKQIYLGMVVLYEDKQEVIPVVQNINSLEYEITRAIKKLTSSVTPKVAFTSGHGELSRDENLTYIDQVMSQEYELETLNLSKLASIPLDVQVLYVIGPKTPFSEWELYLLDQFLMRGGRLGLLIDYINADVQRGQAQPLDAGFGPFLEHFGLAVKPGMIVDVQNSQISVTQQQGPFRFQSLKEYPFFPQITHLSDDNLIVKDLESLNMIFASALDTTRFISDGDLQYDVLAYTSEKSGVLQPPYDISPMRDWTRGDFTADPQPMGVAITGHFTSYFSDKPKPPMDTLITDAVSEPKLESGDQGRLVFWADADFVSDQVLRDQSNLVMFQNMTDWLAQSQGLIAIRSKNVTSRPLDEVEDSTRTFVKFLNIFAIPILVIIFGVGRWQIRKQNRRRQLL